MADTASDTAMSDVKDHKPVIDEKTDEKDASMNGHAPDAGTNDAPKVASEINGSMDPEPTNDGGSPTQEKTARADENCAAATPSTTEKGGDTSATQQPDQLEKEANGATPSNVPEETKTTKDASAGLAKESVVPSATSDVGQSAQVDKIATDEPAAPKDQGQKPEAVNSELDVTKDTVMEEAPSTKEELPVLPKTEKSASPIAAPVVTSEPGDELSADVSMTDDTPAIKIARDREDDTDVAPAPKRARTGSREPESAISEAEPRVSAPAETQSHEADHTEGPVVASIEVLPSGEVPSLASLGNWDDAEKDKSPLTDHRRREARKALAKAKKTRHGTHFRDAVIKLWPALADPYMAKIEKPMDLSELDRNLRSPESPYTTLGEFKRDLSRIFLNALDFNGPAHDVTRSALITVNAVWSELVQIPAEEPPRAKPIPKAKSSRDARTSMSGNASHLDTSLRRQSAGVAGSPASAVAETPVPMSAHEKGALPEGRRASLLADVDRPKRTVRAPKSKDIDYSTKSSRKKLKPELQFCSEVLSEISSMKHYNENVWFLEPVDAEGLNIPHYYDTIKKPMDLGKVARLLNSGDIGSLKEFDKTVRLIFQNCYLFNGPPEQGNDVSKRAKDLERLYESAMKGKDSWLAKHAKANAPASDMSDDEDDDGYEVGVEDRGPSAEQIQQVRDLEAKLKEESLKTIELFMDDVPNETLIDVSRSIVKTLGDAIIKAKQGLTEARQRQEKNGKKSGKSAKAKGSNGASGRKSSSGNALSKKFGPKKSGQKKTLTAADKDQIANAINDLELDSLDQAIEIIKYDTGQNENPDGELELDIDQLSNGALLKLWELCKRVIPGFGKSSSGSGSAHANNAPSAPKAGAAAGQSKKKKSKPMTAQEQEDRIAQLRSLRGLYQSGQEPGDMDTTMGGEGSQIADTSEESSSEEE